MRKTKKKISGQKRPNPKKKALLSSEHDLESSESERFFACTRDRLLFKLVFLISPFLACFSATWKGNEIHLYEVHFTLLFFVIQFKIQSEESEEMARFKDLFPDMKSPDSLYNKSPVG